MQQKLHRQGNQPRFDTFVREKHGRVHRVHNRQRNFRKCYRYRPSIRTQQPPFPRQHEHTDATCTFGSDPSHIVRANYQTLSSRAQPIEATNNCPDTGRNNMGTEDHDRSISPRVFVEYFYLPWNYRRNGVFHNERRSNDWDYAIDRWAMQDARLS